MGAQWSEANIIRLLITATLDTVDQTPGLLVRYEALILGMHAVTQGIMVRFGERGRSICDGYCSEMVPYLVAGGLPKDRLADHVQRRFAEYDELLKKWGRAPDRGLYGMTVGSVVAANVTGSKVEEVGWEANWRWFGWYMAVCKMLDEVTIPQFAPGPGILTRLWRSVQRVLRGS